MSQTSSKKALLIGCNYRNTAFELSGCINDCIQWYNILQDAYGFNESDIVFLRDDKADFKPTRQRIITELTNLVAAAPAYFCLVYSGHGTSTPDMNSDESDKMDECIVPCDVQTAGIISDDVINGIIKNSKSTGLAIFDCCRSGTVLDLPYTGISALIVSGQIAQNNIICLSGCRDNQESMEVYNLNNMLPQGALTITVLNYLRKSKYYPKMSELLKNISEDIQGGGLTQQPILSSLMPLYNDTLFPLVPTYVAAAEALMEALMEPLSSQVKALNAQNAALSSQVGALNGQVTDLTGKLTEATRKNNQIAGQLVTMAGENRNLSSQVATLTTQNRTLTAQVAPLNTQIKTLTNQMATLRTQNTALTTQIATLNKVKK
jgi:cell division protein FtsB